MGEVVVVAQVLSQVGVLKAITEFANASVVEPEPGASPVPTLDPGCSEKHTPQVESGPPQWARPSFTGGFPGSAFTPQPDGTLRCPADRPLSPQERRIERDGSDAGSCMPLVLAIVALVHCVRTVKKAVPASSLDG
jgi:hypothetical protein